MTGTEQSFQVFRCPACGKPTTESLPACRHCGAKLHGDDAGESSGWLERTFDIKSPAGKYGCIGTMIAVGLLLFVGISYCSNRMEQNARIAAEQEAANNEREEARYREQVRNGEVCSDGPKGLNTSLELSVKSDLKDADSFDHMGTVITRRADGSYDALMRYRAKNSFGAFTTGTAIARLYLAERGLCVVRSYRMIE